VLLQPAEPQLHRLDINYRSHAGILDVASALVSVIQDFFPNTVDRCAPLTLQQQQQRSSNMCMLRMLLDVCQRCYT
jgi:hypothetical protein